jgi:quinol monooxygenase YgiN
VIGRLMAMTAQPGRGPEPAAVLRGVAERLRDIAGCQSYLIGQDPANPDTVHVIEVWQDDASAQAALDAPPPAGAPTPADVRALPATPPHRTNLTVLGGVGLATDHRP